MVFCPCPQDIVVTGTRARSVNGASAWRKAMEFEVSNGRAPWKPGEPLDIRGIHLKRDSLSSITYSEKLNSGKSSATLQSTDRHYGIVGQKRSHFQRDS
jgi:hypothetical protein